MEALKNINWPAGISADKIINIGLIILFSYLIIQILVLLIKRTKTKVLNPTSRMVISNWITYIGVFIVILMVFRELKIDLTPLLGAAGIIGIVVGVASQTSLGNIISGIFLVSEKSFEVGELIRVGEKLGVVYSIDLLSVKLKTMDNLLIRIPHQTLITTDMVNISRFPIRRMDFELSVAYKEDLGKVNDILKSIAKESPICLDEPEPLILFKNFGDSGIEILFGIWFERSSYALVKNSVFRAIKERFDEENIEIPFPHVTLYTGEATKPFPVRTESTSTKSK